MKRSIPLARVSLAMVLLSSLARLGVAQEVPGRKPEVWAVIVGIDFYNDRTIPDCTGAIRDGRELGRWLTDTARWNRQHVLLMNESGASRHGDPKETISVLSPTRENLDWAVTRWLGHRVRQGDLAIVYFAGQAAVAGERTALLPLDAKADDLEKTGWFPDDSVDKLARKRCSIAFWLDTSPMGRGRPVVKAAAAGTEPGLQLLNSLTRWPGATAWLAADGQPAAEGPGHSPFFAALAKGLGSRPGNLTSCLSQMLQDPALQKQGFWVRGGVAPDLTLWPADLVPRNLSRPEVLIQQGHADVVTSVIPSEDGAQMITASLDSTIRIWDTHQEKPKLSRVLPYHMIGVTAMALSPDGRFLASGDGAGQVRVWDLVQDRERPREGPQPHQSGTRITQIAFFPDKNGGKFVSLDQDARSMIWDTTGPVLRVRPLTAVEVVRMVGASQEGAQVALALIEADGKVHLLGEDGTRKGAPVDGTGGRPTSVDLTPDGRRLAVGDEDGRVRVWDLKTRASVFVNDYGDLAIRAVRLGAGDTLAVASGGELYLATLGEDGKGRLLDRGEGDIDSAVFSPDGKWLSTLTVAGDQRIWQLAGRDNPEPRTLVIEGKATGLSCQAFTRDGRRLIAGEGEGGVRNWELATRRERTPIASHRGKIDVLQASADGRFLLHITHDRQAMIWDLKNGRGAKPVPGGWTSGAFLPGNDRLVMTRDPKHGGDLVLVNREDGRVQANFERPPTRLGKGPSRVNFGRVVVTRDGKKVAAAPAPDQSEMACVWDIDGGRPLVVRGHTRALTALDFSADGRYLLTGSEDGTAKVWDLKAEVKGEATEAIATLADPQERSVTAARFSPTDPHKVVTAHRSIGPLGVIARWQWEAGKKPTPRALGEVQGRTHAVVFTPDGRFVGGAGQDRALHFWSIDEGPAAARIVFDPAHQHTEQVNALTTGGDKPTFISGSDDTTIRIWAIDPKTRRGTLNMTLASFATFGDDLPRPGVIAQNATGADWVAYTPDGVYDSSLNGDRMISFIMNREVRPLEQFAARLHKFQLTDELRQGIRPEAPAFTEPPALVIDPPPLPDIASRDTILRISLADPEAPLDELRLYQNGVPIRVGSDFKPDKKEKGRYVVPVKLVSGVNRFYAMAGRRDDIDARSQDVDLHYGRQKTPSRVHVIALGVKSYSRNALKYADQDARDIAQQIHLKGVGDSGEAGEKIVLTDSEVTQPKVEEAFTRLRNAVRGRPEDTVVVFLAGHTDILKSPTGRERFSLLLPRFPFPKDAPLVAMNLNRGVGVAGNGVDLPRGVDLPFLVLFRNLKYLDALQRLVIIDACQAEAIYDDPGVRMIEKSIEEDSRQTRTSYLLAARRGEMANESQDLEHGLLTYVLLRGMDAPGLKPLPKNLAQLEPINNADTNRDGIVTTRELREFADRSLSALSKHLPELAQRGPTGAISSTKTAPVPMHLQATDGGFGLITLKKEATTASVKSD